MQRRAEAGAIVRNAIDVDQRDFGDALLQHADARFDEPLPLLRRLVFGVLAQVAELARALDFLRQLELQLAVERLDLVFELLDQPSFIGRPWVGQSYHSAILRADVTAITQPAEPARRAVPRRGARRRSDGVLLLDGAHLVADALAAGIAYRAGGGGADAASERRDPSCSSIASRAPASRRVTVAASGDGRDQPGAIAERDRRAREAAGLDRDRALHRRRLRSSSIAADVQDPGNLGAIVRVAEAAGADRRRRRRRVRRPVRLEGAARIDGQRAAPADRRSPRAGDAVADARRRGCRIIATVPRDGRPLFEASTSAGRWPSLIGGEGRGLSAAVIDAGRRAGHDSDAGAGRVAERGGDGGAARRMKCSARQAERQPDGHRGRREVAMDSLFPTMTPPRSQRPTRRRRSPSGCGRARSTSSSARTICSRPGKPLREAIERDLLQSIILWGPPGTGKTTLARIIADTTKARFVSFSAVLAGHQGNPRRDGGGRAPAARRPAAARSSSSTRSTASTRRSRTRSCRASRPATSSSSARRPRTRRSRSTRRCCRARRCSCCAA